MLTKLFLSSAVDFRDDLEEVCQVNGTECVCVPVAFVFMLDDGVCKEGGCEYPKEEHTEQVMSWYKINKMFLIFLALWKCTPQSAATNQWTQLKGHTLATGMQGETAWKRIYWFSIYNAYGTDISSQGISWFDTGGQRWPEQMVTNLTMLVAEIYSKLTEIVGR